MRFRYTHQICCSGADICSDCWPPMTIAIKVIDTALRGFWYLALGNSIHSKGIIWELLAVSRLFHLLVDVHKLAIEKISILEEEITDMMGVTLPVGSMDNH